VAQPGVAVKGDLAFVKLPTRITAKSIKLAIDASVTIGISESRKEKKTLVFD
jgi:hypothetical protein